MRTRDTLRSQIGPFAMVPVWVLDATKDLIAIALYAHLAKYANRQRRAWPKHERLASDLGISERSLRRALTELRRIEAVETSAHRRPDGTIDGTEYLLVAVPNQRPSVATSRPPVAGGPDDAAATRGRSGRPPVATAYKEEPDPLNQIQRDQQQGVRTDAASAADDLSVFGGYEFDPADKADAFALLWNSVVADTPLLPVRSMTVDRRRLARLRLVDAPVSVHRLAMQKIASSTHCRNENGKGFLATFDWYVATDGPRVKALEGVYDDHFSETELRAAADMCFKTTGRTCPHSARCSDWRECPAVLEMALSLRARRQTA